ncbi:MAG: hypothetical protein ACTHNW_06430 [Mucilaginibacter sp.]
MKRKLLTGLLGIAIVSSALFTSCKKGNSSTSGKSASQLAFAMKADNASISANAISADGQNSGTQWGTTDTIHAMVNWTSAIANVSAFKLEAIKRGLSIEITSRGLQNINLFAPVPTSISTMIDTGTYTKVELRAILLRSSDTSAMPLTLKGSFTTTGGTVVPVVVDYNNDAIIKVEAKNVTITSTSDLLTTLTVHLNMLLAGVSTADMNNATRVNGVILINSTTNSGILEHIRDNLFHSCDGGDFHDHHEND